MKMFAAIILSIIILQSQAQEAAPRHFRPGRIVLADSTLLTGYVRDFIHTNASVVFWDAKTGARRSLTGSQLLAVDIDTTRWLCVKGDFFRVLVTGDHWFVQKSSDASGKPVFNGTEPILANGTEGRLNDYFLYDPAARTLKLVK